MVSKKKFSKTTKSAKKLFKNFSDEAKDLYNEKVDHEKIKESFDIDKLSHNIKSELKDFHSDISEFCGMINKKYLKNITFEKTAEEIDKLDEKISDEVEKFYTKLKNINKK